MQANWSSQWSIGGVVLVADVYHNQLSNYSSVVRQARRSIYVICLHGS